MKLPTGVRRLDELLSGGLPERGAALIYGPPFHGKEALLRQFILANVRADIPTTVVLTDQTAADHRNLLKRAEPTLGTPKKAALVRYVDTYSKSIGMAETVPNTELVDGLLNFNAVSTAVNNAQRDFIRNHAQQAFVFDSVSTLIAYTNANTAFRYLQVLLGKVKAAGASSFLSLSQGMHGDADVQMVKHLMDGFIELKTDNNKPLLRIEGLGVSETRGWVEYKFSDQTFEITGSFSAGRIR